jgi:hypothetical protein
MPLPSVESATPPTGCGSPQTTAVAEELYDRMRNESEQNASPISMALTGSATRVYCC